MENNETNKEKIIEAVEKTKIEDKTLLVIKSHPSLNTNKDGIEVNEGYDFETDGALPEVAHGVAMFAVELEKNGYGKDSGAYFVYLIGEYFRKAKI